MDMIADDRRPHPDGTIRGPDSLLQHAATVHSRLGFLDYDG
jgi:hypothetical protein